MKILLNDYEVHMRNKITQISKDKSITSMDKLKEALAKENIKMKLDKSPSGHVRNISFSDKRGKFEIDGEKGAQAHVWKNIERNVSSNSKEAQEQAQAQASKPQYNRFDELKKQRDESAKRQQEQSNKQSKSLGL